jgi:hypothetical protein
VKPSSVKRGFLRRLLRDIEEHGERKLEYARYDRLLGDPDYHLLKQLTSLDVNAMLKRYVSKLHQHAHLSDDHIGALPFSVLLPWSACGPRSGSYQAAGRRMHVVYMHSLLS